MSVIVDTVDQSVLSMVEPPAYRGPDRRAARIPSHTHAASVAFAAFLLGSHAVVLAAAWQGSWSVSGSAGPTAWLTATVAVVSAMASAVHTMRWRLFGSASALWVAGAMLVYAAANVAFPGLLRSFADGTADVGSGAALLRPTSVFVVMALLAIAAATPAVDARLRPRRVAAVLVILGAVGLTVAWLSSDFRLIFGPALDRVPDSGPGAIGQVAVGVLWLTLAVAFLWKRDWSSSAPWIGVMLLSLAEARLTLAVSVGGDPAWVLASQVCRLFGVAAALGGGVYEVQLAFARQRSTLLDSLAELGSARARRRAELASAEERSHDIRSALTGIGGAALTLQRYHDQLTVEERERLAEAVSAEITRLQSIVIDVRAEPEPFALSVALQPVLTCAASHGMEIATDVPADLVVVGRANELVEAVRNLLDNAHRHASGSRVDVRAERSEAGIALRVEDRGAGIPVRDHDRIFERGWRGHVDAEGSGLGLHVAARLVREQGGQLRVEDRPGGGASFVLTMPAAVQEGAC